MHRVAWPFWGVVYRNVMCNCCLMPQLSSAKTAEELESILNTCKWRWSIGGLSTTITFDKIEQFVMEVTKYFVIIKCQPMLDQLIEGLRYY